MNENNEASDLEEAQAQWWCQWFDADYLSQSFQHHYTPGFLSCATFGLISNPDDTLCDKKNPA